MTDDNIDLPPLPSSLEGSVLMLLIRDYTAQAIRADRERRAKVAAKPVVHKARIVLKPDGGAWFPVGGDYLPIAGEIGVTLCWTADCRAWIESERNRELARRLRIVAEVGYTSPTDKIMRDAADALDGGM